MLEPLHVDKLRHGFAKEVQKEKPVKGLHTKYWAYISTGVFITGGRICDIVLDSFDLSVNAPSKGINYYSSK